MPTRPGDSRRHAQSFRSSAVTLGRRPESPPAHDLPRGRDRTRQSDPERRETDAGVRTRSRGSSRSPARPAAALPPRCSTSGRAAQGRCTRAARSRCWQRGPRGSTRMSREASTCSATAAEPRTSGSARFPARTSAAPASRRSTGTDSGRSRRSASGRSRSNRGTLRRDTRHESRHRETGIPPRARRAAAVQDPEISAGCVRNRRLTDRR